MNKKTFKLSTILCASALSVLTIVGTVSFIKVYGESLAPALQRCEDYTVRFKINENASKYVVHDDVDYKDGLVLTNADADANGYIYYETETVGTHDVYITAYIDGATYTSDSITVTNKPMFYYGTHHPMYFYDIDNATKTGVYTLMLEDGTFFKCTQEEFNSIYNKTRGQMMDYSAPEHVDQAIDNFKQVGANVIFLGSRLHCVEEASYWWFPGNFENSVCKRFMDAAWRRGMKCIITDFPIQYSCETADLNKITQRLSNSELKKALTHPAFYGLQIEDEPAADQIANVGASVKHIMNFWRNDSLLSKYPEPIIYTALRSYDENKSEEFGYFENQEAYKNYIKSWVTETGLDYFAFDTYTYTTRYYGTKKKYGIVGETLYYDPSKVIYDAINQAESELGRDIEVLQVLTASTDDSRKTVPTSTDIFSSTFLAVGQDVDGYALYAFRNDKAVQGAAVDYHYKFTDTYFYVQKANKQYRKIQSLLEGYNATSKEISTYGYNNNLYGPGVRTVTTTFTNNEDNSKTYQYVANFESASDNTTYSVTVPSGKIYYLFGYNQDTEQRIGTGNTVTINNGEAILVSSESALTVSSTAFDKTMLSDYDVITISDLAGTNSVNNTTGFGINPAITPTETYYKEVNTDNGSVALRFNYTAEKLGTAWGDGIVDIYLNNNTWDGGYQFSIGCNSGDVYNKTANVITKNILKANQDNIVEVGAIRINKTAQTYTYIKVNDQLISDNVLDTTTTKGVAHLTMGANNTTGTNVVLESVKLNRKTDLGTIQNVSGSANTINFTTTNTNQIAYNLSDNSVKTYTFNGNTLTKLGHNKYSLTLANSVEANTIVNIGGHYSRVDGATKDVYVLENIELFYNGSTWININDINQVNAYIDLAYSFTTKGSTITKEQFYMVFAIDNIASDTLSSLGEYGIKVSTNSITKYYPIERTHLDEGNNTRYVVVDLGTPISSKKYDDVFTVQAYLLINGTYILSEQSVSGSIKSIVTDLYNDAATKNSVKNLYNYINK